ncbi:hypothetical protein AB0M47_01740 [Hamadaea sp. NPDC051192]|uniref:hypothetical protein n=1 Tax=Hamadaea sp. NPDC051192 TaxID=3154940 RepID=UPI00341A77A3
MTLLNTVADRLLTRIVPKVKAEAGPCACDPGSHWWGAHCYCSGAAAYRRYYTCSSNCVDSSYYCRYAGNTCV